MPRPLRICRHCEASGKSIRDAFVSEEESRHEHLAVAHDINIPNDEWKNKSVKQAHFRAPATRIESDQIGADEESLYNGVKAGFERLFNNKFGNCHFEITAHGTFTAILKSKVPQSLNIIFSFLKRNNPDVTGFFHTNLDTNEFVTIEVKKDSLTLDNVIQAKAYADLFLARYGILISTKQIPEELKRLHMANGILNRQLSDKTSSYLFLAEWSRDKSAVFQGTWYPQPPFIYDENAFERKSEPKGEDLHLDRAYRLGNDSVRFHLTNNGLDAVTINHYSINGGPAEFLAPPVLILPGDTQAATIKTGSDLAKGEFDLALISSRMNRFEFRIVST